MFAFSYTPKYSLSYCTGEKMHIKNGDALCLVTIKISG